MDQKRQIYIHENLRISELIKGFITLYPYLKLEIFKKGEEMSHNYRDFKLIEIATVRNPVGFYINKDMKVSEVEALFWDKLGIQISIYRKMGNSVVETSYTSQWTLDHQNEKGKEIYSAI
jgi:hypothetical protein